MTTGVTLPLKTRHYSMIYDHITSIQQTSKNRGRDINMYYVFTMCFGLIIKVEFINEDAFHKIQFLSISEIEPLVIANCTIRQSIYYSSSSSTREVVINCGSLTACLTSLIT